MPKIVSPEEHTINRGITIPRNLWIAAQKHAKSEKRSFSGLVVLAVRQYLNGAQRNAHHA